MSEALVGFTCAICKCPCELWGCAVLYCRHPTKEDFEQAAKDLAESEPAEPYSKQKIKEMVQRIVTAKSCTCLGTCRGVDGLGAGWRCVLTGAEGIAMSEGFY